VRIDATIIQNTYKYEKVIVKYVFVLDAASILTNTNTTFPAL
jgi:hypothetical protein